MPNGKVLSLQSYVVSSYAGGKGVTLILQTRGYDVDSIYSVIFSNHTAYTKLYGTIKEDGDFHELYRGLQHNHLNHYDIIISGCMQNCGFASYLSKVVQEQKQKNPNLTYYFDPVLGENGTFNCPESFVELYKDQLLPYADVITPNQFEAEKLSDVTIKDKNSAIEACQQLHRLGAKTVIITSVEGLSACKKILTCVLSEMSENEIKTIFIDIPHVDNCLIGSGDCFPALIAAAFAAKGFPTTFADKTDAVRQSLTSMIRIIERSTAIDSQKTPLTAEELSLKKSNPGELALSDCIDIILDDTTVSTLLDSSDVTITQI